MAVGILREEDEEVGEQDLAATAATDRAIEGMVCLDEKAPSDGELSS